MKITINIAELNDVEIINKLATEIWNEHYISIISQEQIDYMLNWMYSTESLQKQLNDNCQFHILNINQEAVGFISIQQNNAKSSQYFLHKLYVKNKYRKLHLGQFLVNFATSDLHNCEIVLNVNRQNYKAINFYFKMGFKIKQVIDVTIGNGYEMNDFVMHKHI